MSSFFTMFAVTTLFTVLAKFGVLKFTSLQAEYIAKDNFEFFFYTYLMLTGVLAASNYESRSWFRKFIKAFTGIVKGMYLGFSGALVGWGFGLLVCVFVKRDFHSVALGLVLTSYMLLISIAPAWYHEIIEKEKEKMIGYLFREPRFAKIFQLLGCVFIIASAFGFYDFFTRK